MIDVLEVRDRLNISFFQQLFIYSLASRQVKLGWRINPRWGMVMKRESCGNADDRQRLWIVGKQNQPRFQCVCLPEE